MYSLCIGFFIWLFLGVCGLSSLGLHIQRGDSSKIARAESLLLIVKIDMDGYFPRFINRPLSRLLLFSCPSRFISTREQFSAISKKQLKTL